VILIIYVPGKFLIVSKNNNMHSCSDCQVHCEKNTEKLLARYLSTYFTARRMRDILQTSLI
ncbi:hypothetical protein QUF72_15295, partial [Desulfobacterales bacterium HSG2]|nr:hypothetical protein [Desulfobacterales bacterium HSG2]